MQNAKNFQGPSICQYDFIPFEAPTILYRSVFWRPILQRLMCNVCCWINWFQKSVCKLLVVVISSACKQTVLTALINANDFNWNRIPWIGANSSSHASFWLYVSQKLLKLNIQIKHPICLWHLSIDIHFKSLYSKSSWLWFYVGEICQRDNMNCTSPLNTDVRASEIHKRKDLPTLSKLDCFCRSPREVSIGELFLNMEKKSVCVFKS